ncbi:MAG: Na(+)-translocating NADH-quinone reductase subunit A [Bacteroidaceae bacterium]|nr:Na(+)-translocating NADH-quinone reductase subunit A [Bacteroidaceae bacterium]
MTNVIKIGKGLDIKLKGIPAKEFFDVKLSDEYALVPDNFHGVTPKVVVKPEEHVKAGGVLFIDKNHPEVNFVSPVSGVVTQVERGARRKVLAVHVKADAEQQYENFGKRNPSEMSGGEVKELLLKAGLFAFFNQRPYDMVAEPSQEPRAIFVSAFDSKPLATDFEVVLKGQETYFQTGLLALSKMAKTYLGISSQQTAPSLTAAKHVEVTVFKGPHPAGNVGVQIHHVAPINKGEVVWTIGAEEVIFIGRLLAKGEVDFTRTISLVGSEITTPAYCKVITGAKISSVLQNRVKKSSYAQRYIDGNVLTGMQTSTAGFLSAKATQITVIPDGSDVHEFFGWIMPRFNDFSANRSYFSWFCKNHEYALDARVKGGERHMIMSNEYDRVFPMDIYPEYLIKAIITGDIDGMEALGIYEVAPEDFALCEFVDSSKLELQRIVREGLDALHEEMC